jgi:ABC-type molybdate transport system ATPase subunit
MLKIISAEERMAAPRHIKAAIFGPSGIGKTSLLRGLTIPSLFIDLEGGDLSVADCAVDSIKVRRWEDARDLACLIGGT